MIWLLTALGLVWLMSEDDVELDESVLAMSPLRPRCSGVDEPVSPAPSGGLAIRSGQRRIELGSASYVELIEALRWARRSNDQRKVLCVARRMAEVRRESGEAQQFIIENAEGQMRFVSGFLDQAELAGPMWMDTRPESVPRFSERVYQVVYDGQPPLVGAVELCWSREAESKIGLDLARRVFGELEKRIGVGGRVNNDLRLMRDYAYRLIRIRARILASRDGESSWAWFPQHSARVQELLSQSRKVEGMLYLQRTTVRVSAEGLQDTRRRDEVLNIEMILMDVLMRGVYTTLSGVLFDVALWDAYVGSTGWADWLRGRLGEYLYGEPVGFTCEGRLL